MPLLVEMTMSTAVICVAMCKPKNCYLGNCGGTGDPDRLGAAPHRCNTTDAMGTFDTSAGVTLLPKPHKKLDLRPLYRRPRAL